MFKMSPKGALSLFVGTATVKPGKLSVALTN